MQGEAAVRGCLARAVRGANSTLAEEMLLIISVARSRSDFGPATRAVRGANSTLAEEMLLSISGASMVKQAFILESRLA